ncbi:protein Z-dependent protease inhibitor-like [Sphaeramia orbicularis]|uniref:Protein Z-dependent protease inhibitor-like n=1 Tax=Sphaeramia orbicularis TaxID=375764 RepID=A0A673AF90_9TELE|nr:protein Z-dependent protease inhibitor-like [Sphaeramia orbicularis]
MIPAMVAVVLLLLSSASSQMMGGLGQDLSDLSYRTTDFSTRLYRAVARRTDDNVFLSTFTLCTGVSALMNAATGSTQEQLQQTLSQAGMDPQRVADLFQSFRTSISQGGGEFLKQGVAVFPSQSFEMSASYVDLVQTKYGGKAQNVDYSTPLEAADTINRWAQDQVGESIQTLVTQLDPQTQLLLATAASHRVRFTLPFNASQTREERFYVDKYHVVMVPMMFRSDKYFLAYDRQLQVGVLKLPMAEGVAMLVILPDEGVDITDVEDKVTAEKVQGWIRQLKKTRLEVQLPRFLLERSYSLQDVLQTMGVTQVFQDEADFSNMGGTKGPKLTQVVHKSIINVDETSTTPATDVVFSSPPPRLTINRPFLFVVYHEATSTLMSIGRVADPKKT